MNKFLLTTSLACFFFLGDAICQFPEQLMVQQQFFNHYGKIYAKGTKPTELTGPQFLYETWMPVEVKTREFEAALSAAKLNLYTANIEVLHEGQEKLIYPTDFQQVKLQEDGRTKVFVPAQRYRIEGKVPTGFMEVIGDGEEMILVQHYTGIKEPGPSANIVGGPTGSILIKGSKTYIYNRGKFTLVKNKKQFSKYFKSKSKKAKSLMKEKKTDFKDPYQLHEIMQLVYNKQ